MTGDANRPVAVVTGARRGIGLAIAPRPGRGRLRHRSADFWSQRRSEAIGLARELEVLGAATLLLQVRPRRPRSPSRHRRPHRRPFGRIDCSSTMPASAPPVRGDLLDLKPENFDKVAGRQSARHRLPQPGRRQGDARGTGRHAAHRSSPSPRSAPKWRRPSAPTTASPRPGCPCGPRRWRCGSRRRASRVFEVRPGIIRTDDDGRRRRQI